MEFLPFTSSYPLNVPADHIVDSWDYHLSGLRFLGDAFPAVWPNFGPGIAAGFLGATVEPRPDTVWFHPKGGTRRPADLHFRPAPLDTPWFVRVEDIARAAQHRFRGNVQVGMTDLGGTLDVLSAFRPGEALLLDLYDEPDEIRRLTGELHEAWWAFFDRLDRSLRPPNPGYTAWTPIFSETPYYMLQCDFAYMIGPEMFDAFARPELAASCRRLDHAFYHLDGVGQLPHLDSLLSIPELRGIQWVPGAGQPDITNWPEVYRRIRGAGKLIQIFGGERELDALAGQLGSGEGIIAIGSYPAEREADARRFLKRYGAE